MKISRLLSLLKVPPASVAGFILFFALASTAFVAVQHSASAVQPVAFNHAKHVENGMTCTDCHSGVESQAKATLPAIDTCLNCHETALTASAEEAKIRTAAAAGQPLRWVQLTQEPPHVFFSHRRHVAVANLACAECHGPVEKSTAPPPRPWRVLDMEACIGCHQKHGVNADCNDCHH